MPIRYDVLRNLATRHLLRALERAGFKMIRQRGSHVRYGHPDGRRVTLPEHGSNAPIRLLTLKHIVEQQARWTEEDLRRLKLLRA